MRRIKEVVETLQISEKIILEYIERKWIKPEEETNEWYFSQEDLARAKFIHELQKDFFDNYDLMDIVLSLLDQLHGARYYIKSINQAIDKQPKEVQAEIFSLLKRGYNE